MLLKLLSRIIAIQIVSAYVNIILDNFEIGYPVKFDKMCHTEHDRFNYIEGISVAECVKECSARLHCQALCFRSRLNVCEHFTSSNSSHLRHGNCIYIAKNNVDTKKNPCTGGCNYGEVCETSGSDIGICTIKECINVTIPEHGRILGNQRKVGQRIRYDCNRGFAATNDSVAECLDTGVWNVCSECTETPTLGLPCYTDADCLETEGRCIEGICFCHPFYRYNVSVQDCVKVCNELTDSFIVTQNAIIRDLNDIEEATVYPAQNDCETGCILDPTCLSFETWKVDGQVKCTKSSLSRNMVHDAIPEILDFFPNVQLHSRLCN